MMRFSDDFMYMVGVSDMYEEDIFDGILPGDLSPVEAERISAVGRSSTLWEDS